MEIIPDSAAASIQADQIGFERVNDSLITTTSFDDINVESGQTYYYSLSSVDVFDVESLMSNTASFTPSAPALRPPSRVSVRSVSTGVELRWNQTLQDGAMGYRVYRRARGESDATAVGMNQLEETRFTDENVSEGELYWYSVSVIGENAESEASSEESVRVD
jgi:fibronectin type 3 domain-containing protein